MSHCLLPVLEDACSDLVLKVVDLATLRRDLVSVLDLFALKFAEELIQFITLGCDDFKFIFGLLGLSFGVLLSLIEFTLQGFVFRPLFLQLFI